MRYTIKEFNKQFKSDSDCLAYIYRAKYPTGATCAKCEKKDHFRPVKGRRAYACMCGHHIHPTAGTIYHKSPTPLKSWFFAMFLMTTSKNGVSAKELERHLGVTYKCAWRMAHQIRLLLNERVKDLQGTIEADETYIGGVDEGKQNRGSVGKIIVAGMLERRGNVIAKVVKDSKAETLLPNIIEYVMPESTIITDEYNSYRRLRHLDFKHFKVQHKKKEFVRGFVHTNSIEGFWSQLKRSIHGTFHFVSRKHLQKYVNEFSYRYNRRHSKTPMFCHLLEGVGRLHAPAV